MGGCEARFSVEQPYLAPLPREVERKLDAFGRAPDHQRALRQFATYPQDFVELSEKSKDSILDDTDQRIRTVQQLFPELDFRVYA